MLRPSAAEGYQLSQEEVWAYEPAATEEEDQVVVLHLLGLVERWACVCEDGRRELL